jgi:hypothetical protein
MILKDVLIIAKIGGWKMDGTDLLSSTSRLYLVSESLDIDPTQYFGVSEARERW